jgi:hypothetical protein
MYFYNTIIGKQYPEENGVTNECKMKVKQKDVDEFLFRLRKDDYTTRLFKFRLIFERRETFQTKCVIEPFNWVWTFPGGKGAMQFLKWPMDIRYGDRDHTKSDFVYKFFLGSTQSQTHIQH